MQTLDRDKPNEFFDVEYALSPELTRGKKKVTVKFQGHPGNFAGGVFGCAILRTEEKSPSRNAATVNSLGR